MDSFLLLLGVTALGLWARRYHWPPGSARQISCLGRLRSWCWRLRLFGGKQLDWRPYILLPFSPTFGLGVTSDYQDDRTVETAEAEEQERRKRRDGGALSSFFFSFFYLSGRDEYSCVDSGISSSTCRQDKTRKDISGKEIYIPKTPINVDRQMKQNRLFFLRLFF